MAKKDKKTERINFRTTEKIMKAIREGASKSKRSVNNFIEYLALQKQETDGKQAA